MLTYLCWTRGGWTRGGGKGYEGSFHSKGEKTVSLFDSAVSNVGEVITSGARVGREPGSEVAAGMPGGPEEVGVRGHRCCPEPPGSDEHVGVNNDCCCPHVVAKDPASSESPITAPPTRRASNPLFVNVAPAALQRWDGLSYNARSMLTNNRQASPHTKCI